MATGEDLRWLLERTNDGYWTGLKRATGEYSKGYWRVLTKTTGEDSPKLLERTQYQWPQDLFGS